MRNTILKEVHHYNKKDFLFSCYEYSINKIKDYLPLHIHEEIEIIHFEKGNFLYEINFNNYHINQESIIIINSNCIHGGKSLHEVSSKTSSGTILEVNPAILESSLNDYSTSKYISFLLNNKNFPIIISKEDLIFQSLLNFLNECKSLFSEKKYLYELKIKIKLMEFFMMILESNKINYSNFSSKDIENKKKIEKVIYFIHKNYKKNISLKEGANILSLSDSYFSKYFKEYTGHKFIDYLNNYRLNESVNLLVNSNISITEICYEAGFQNLSYFIRKFKENYKCSPSEYRKKLKVLL
jgi:AraC-like DNA-binding protein